MLSLGCYSEIAAPSNFRIKSYLVQTKFNKLIFSLLSDTVFQPNYFRLLKLLWYYFTGRNRHILIERIHFLAKNCFFIGILLLPILDHSMEEFFAIQKHIFFPFYVRMIFISHLLQTKLFSKIFYSKSYKSSIFSNHTSQSKCQPAKSSSSES